VGVILLVFIMKKSLREHAFVPALSVLSLALASAVQAQASEEILHPVTVVTAFRIPQDPALLPMGVSVISAEEIRAAGVADLSEAIRWLGGVVTRIDTTGGRNPSLDIRGFGETASSNLVIMVDGVRLNEGDMGGAAVSWIPVDSIERIEIVRGSGAVLHGEGATAGMINIITGRGMLEAGGAVSVGVGNNGTRDTRIELRSASENWKSQIYGAALNSDNHRDNFRVQERNALARTTWSDSSKSLSAQLGVQSQAGGLPGGMNVAEFHSNPRQSFKLNDNGKTDTANLLLSAELPLDIWRIGADVNHRNVQSKGYYIADGYTTDSKTGTTRLGLRAWRELPLLQAAGRFIWGLDFERWNQDKTTLNPVWGNSNVQIAQSSNALYARQELDWTPVGIKVFAGVRHTESYREAKGDSNGSLDVSNNSWEFGLAKRVAQGAELYGRLGTSFRLPNADEFSCSFGCPPSTLNLLNPQTSKDHELGYRQTYSEGNWTIRYYRSDLRDEIGLGADFMTNMNFDPTRREGVEFEAKMKLNSSLRAGIQAAQRKSSFRKGEYEGREVPLSPEQSLSTNLMYKISSNQQVVLLNQWVSAQRVAGDLSNTCSQSIPSFSLTNLRYSHGFESWIFSGQISNLFDKQYYDYRSRCNPTSRSIYPQAGRTWTMTARRNF
jgi:iron complex outermembrane recepter protein